MLGYYYIEVGRLKNHLHKNRQEPYHVWFTSCLLWAAVLRFRWCKSYWSEQKKRKCQSVTTSQHESIDQKALEICPPKVCDLMRWDPIHKASQSHVTPGALPHKPMTAFSTNASRGRLRSPRLSASRAVAGGSEMPSWKQIASLWSCTVRRPWSDEQSKGWSHGSSGFKNRLCVRKLYETWRWLW